MMDYSGRTRFAPSPTGHLHIGHALHAAFVWGIARAMNLEIILRIEDHDRQRSRPDFEKSILRDLEWLGFIPDGGFPWEGTAARSDYRQSDNEDEYRNLLLRLQQEYHIYACTCSRKDLREAFPEQEGQIPYPGTCRDAKHPMDETGCSIRLQIADESIGFDDLICGKIVQHPQEQSGDLQLRDKAGNWTYQFCVVADDMRHGITHVIRGEDILESTGRQILLMRMLDHQPPAYMHHPLIRNDQGEKLSKRNRDTSIHSLREAGWKPQKLMGHVFDMAGIPAPAAVNPDDLPDIIYDYIRKLNPNLTKT